MLRFCLLILLAFTFISQLYFIFAGLFVFYLVRYESLELVVLAILLDAYYGAFYSLPLLSLVTLLVWISSLFIKQRLLMYTEG